MNVPIAEVNEMMHVLEATMAMVHGEPSLIPSFPLPFMNKVHSVD